MRSTPGTKSGEPAAVTFVTKAIMDCLAGPSFHQSNGSAKTEPEKIKKRVARSMRFMIMPYDNCTIAATSG
jgi:hypothetical protein